MAGVPAAAPAAGGLVAARVNAQTGLITQADDAAALSAYFLATRPPAGAAAAGTPANTGSEPLF